MLWKSSPFSTPTAGRTPQGVSRHRGAVGSLWGSGGFQGLRQRDLRSQPAHTACHKEEAAVKSHPLDLGHWIVFLKEKFNFIMTCQSNEIISLLSEKTSIETPPRSPSTRMKLFVARTLSPGPHGAVSGQLHCRAVQ